MAITFSTSTASVDAGETDLVTGTHLFVDEALVPPQTTTGWIEWVIDLSNMVAGDSYRFRLYKAINTTPDMVVVEDFVVSGAQSQAYLVSARLIGQAWRLTGTRVAGAVSLTVGLSYTRDDGGASITTPIDANVVQWHGSPVASPINAGVPIVDLKYWRGGLVPGTNVTGVPLVDVADWLGTAPATPTVAGIPKVEVASMDSGVITSTVVAANAIGATQIASGAITSAKIAANAIGATQIASGAITSAKIAASAIGASQLATDAIGAAQLAADAVAEIQAGLATAAAVAAIPTNPLLDADARLDHLDADISSRSTLVAQGVWTYAIEGAYTAEQLMRGFASALFAKASGFDGATRTFRDLADTKDRIVGATDATGRTAVTLNLT